MHVYTNVENVLCYISNFHSSQIQKIFLAQNIFFFATWSPHTAVYWVNLQTQIRTQTMRAHTNIYIYIYIYMILYVGQLCMQYTYVCLYTDTHTHTHTKLPNTNSFKSVNMKPILWVTQCYDLKNIYAFSNYQRIEEILSL